MKLVTNDGVVLEGGTAEEIVSALHAMSFSKCDSDEEFISEMVERVKLQTGERIRVGSAEDLVKDLVRLGLLREEEERP